MSAFRYQALGGDGSPVDGVIEAPDRRSALQQLSRRGLFPSKLESDGTKTAPRTLANAASPIPSADPQPQPSGGWRLGSGVKIKDITAFSRQMAALLGASIPIPQALEGLSEEEENPSMRAILVELSSSLRTGASFSAALGMHPRIFSKLYVSLIRVGEEAGALPAVMNDLAALLEHEDEVRSEVISAVAYPMFVLGFGIVTVIILLTVVLPKLFSMLQEMTAVLPWPTLLLLAVSHFLEHYGWVVLLAIVGLAAGYRSYVRTPEGSFRIDGLKLRLPIMGGMFRSAALGRFARTLGTLVKAGVSLLPALKIVEATMGNLVLSQQIAQVADATRGGASLAAPLRELRIFPKSVIQMIAVGEETGRLDDMLLKVATIEERQMRARTKTLISLLAPALILVVGALVGFMVIALLLPIFKMSRNVQ